MIWSAFFGVACLAALVVCHHAREGRACLKVAAWVVFANWALFAASWYPAVAPSFLLYRFGVDVSPEDIWSLTDLISLSIVAYTCRQHWWSPLIWTPYLVCLCMYVVAWVNGLNYMDYNEVLDGALLVQLAVLFTLGGDACADYLSSRWNLRGLGDLARKFLRADIQAARSRR